MDSKTTTCPECGAVLDNYSSCWELFGACMALEMQDPSYSTVHHLTVPAYMLQHPSKLSGKGWLATRDLLVQFLLHGVTPAQVRKQNREAVDSGHRKWRIKGGEPYKAADIRTWHLTIGNVRLDDPKSYCEDVDKWARDVLDKVIKIGE